MHREIELSVISDLIAKHDAHLREGNIKDANKINKKIVEFCRLNNKKLELESVAREVELRSDAELYWFSVILLSLSWSDNDYQEVKKKFRLKTDTTEWSHYRQLMKLFLLSEEEDVKSEFLFKV